MKPRERAATTRQQEQDTTKVGRHRAKLDIIRDSLRPYEADHPATSASSSSFSFESNGLGFSEDSLVNALMKMGYERDAATHATKFTNYQGIDPAISYLRRLQENEMKPTTNGMSNGNNLPVELLHAINESTSSRSTSPQQPSPSALSNGSRQQLYNGRQMTPVAPDLHRTHIRVTRAASYKNDAYQYPIRTGADRPAPMISIDRNPSLPLNNHRTFTIFGANPALQPKTQLESSISAPAGPSQIMVGGASPYSPNPVIMTTFSSAPKNQHAISISVRQNQSGSHNYRLDVTGKDGGVSSVHSSPGHTGVQNIIVNSDEERNYIGYEDELRPSTSFDQGNHLGMGGSRTKAPELPPSPSKPERCTSPIPESIQNRLRNKKYEKYVKPCQPRMYCFYMEQHVERLLQQYREREKRSMQLQREMEAANLPDLMKQKMLEFLQQKESRYMRLRRQKMDVSMFEIIQPIGVGAYGKVFLVKKKDTSQVYAMKSLLKNDVIQKQQAAHVKAERDILSEADSPWIVKLFFSFQDDRCLYFVMEYVPGGDMMQLLINMGIFPEKMARFYIAELSCAVGYVHSLGFIHRDIKPDNILIDQNGHVKLTDFGLCTGLRWTHDRRYYGPENDSTPSHARVDSFAIPADTGGSIPQSMKVLHVRQQKKRNQANSLVGTANYMAPEVILATGHTQLCDWWSIGVILYEMVIGRPPFMSANDDPRETRDKIVNWQRYLDVSPAAIPHSWHREKLSQECLNMITALCRDKKDRLGIQGVREVQNHPWFRGLDFQNLRNTKAEYIPRVEHPEDTSNFDPINLPDVPLETLSRRAPNNPAFYEFTFRHFFDTDAHGCPSLRPAQKRPSLAPLFESSASRHEPNSSSESIVV